MTITTVHVVEVGMALPDVVCLQVRDQEIVKGRLLQLESPAAADLYSRGLYNPVTGAPDAAGSYARVVGQINGTQKMFLKFYDTIPTAYLNRDDVDDAGNWSTIGGRTVTGVFRISRPFGQGYGWNGSDVSITTMEHLLYVQLSGNLPQGRHQISISGNTFPSTSFVFNDKRTRAVGWRVSNAGYRPNDSAKIADFSLWIPGRGTEGVVDLIGDYGLDEFEVIDIEGNVVDSGALTEFIDATTPESGITNLNYASTTTPPKKATAVSNANPCEITIEGHGFETGQVKYLRGFADASGNILTSVEHLRTITVTGDDTFTIGTNTTATGVWSADKFAHTDAKYPDNYDALVFDTWSGNRYGTVVHRADFSAFELPEGHYRLRIPGVGVSDQFYISESAYYMVAKNFAKGWYNQATGIALNGYGDWVRPVDYVQGQAGIDIKLSTLPAYFSNETGSVSAGTGFDVANALPGRSPWITTDSAPAGWGISIRDAGDWDYHAQRHCIMAYYILEHAYRQLPAASRNLNFGFPKASAVIDPSLYAGIDAMGDQVHMALMQLDVWRRYQLPGGRIFGGMQMDNGGSLGGGGNEYEPSYCTTMALYLLESDPICCYVYALAAAKMSQVFSEAGHSSLASTWQTSAVAAYDWAEALWTDYATNGASGSVVQAFFNTTCGYQSGKGYNDTQFGNAMANLFGSATNTYIRYAAIGALYNLTNDKSKYGDKLGGGSIFMGHQTPWLNIAAWEFVQAPSAGDYTSPSSHKDYYNTLWDNSITDARPAHEWWRAFQQPGVEQTQASVGCANMQRYISHDHGRNNRGISLVTGIGPRQAYNTLQRDREAMALAALPGVRVYANPNHQQAGGILFRNVATDSPLNWTVETPFGTQEATYGSKRIIYPTRYQTPIYSMWHDTSYWIYMAEFTTQESIQPQFVTACILHALGENTASNPALPKMTGKLRIAGAQ